MENNEIENYLDDYVYLIYSNSLFLIIHFILFLSMDLLYIFACPQLTYSLFDDKLFPRI